ncbi:MAG: esterase/lipase family protein [Pseudomonadales bacterium]
MKPPCLSLTFTEAPRTVFEFNTGLANKLLLRKAPRGDGHKVMVIPGFLSGDGYNKRLISFLNELGYQAKGWDFGTNLGPSRIPINDLADIVEKWADGVEGSVSLIGHSLGGIYARELARQIPAVVRQVISLGSPFGEGRNEGSYASTLFNRLNPEGEVDPEQIAQRKILATAPPVPTTAVYSKGDGIVNWRTAVQEEGHAQTQNIQVLGSHCGLTHNPAVWHVIADRLQYTKQNWTEFQSRFFNTH